MTDKNHDNAPSQDPTTASARPDRSTAATPPPRFSAPGAAQEAPAQTEHAPGSPEGAPATAATTSATPDPAASARRRKRWTVAAIATGSVLVLGAAFGGGVATGFALDDGTPGMSVDQGGFPGGGMGQPPEENRFGQGGPHGEAPDDSGDTGSSDDSGTSDSDLSDDSGA